MEGACLPIPDPTSLDGVIGGLAKRNCTRNPDIDPEVMAEFESFVGEFLEENLVPLGGKLMSIREYLSQTHYPLWRQRQILDAAILRGFDVDGENDDGLTMRDDECIQHVKHETYAEYKEARLINARPDSFKAFCGPLFHMIEKAVFSLKWFVKYTPVRERAALIASIYSPGCSVYCTDYSSFESMFVQRLWNAAEGQLYRYMTRNLSARLQRVVQRVLTGVNVMKIRTREGKVTTKLVGTRMSGDMCTSLGNGFTNLMMMLFVCRKSGVRVEGFAEGDDGIFTTSGPIATALFSKLGATIKIVEAEANKASFCGNVFDMTERVNVVDPVDKVVRFGWSCSPLALGTGRNHAMLLRAKALSLQYEYPGCPVLASLARWVLRCTPVVSDEKYLNDASLDDWERRRYREARDFEGVRDVPVSERARVLVEELYGLSRSEQLWFEQWFDNASEICPIPLKFCDAHVTNTWRQFWSHDVHY